jgi:hypothetical protein
MPERKFLSPQVSGYGLPMGLPESWIEGYVTMELLEPGEDGEYEMIPYGPEQTTLLQGHDYFDMLCGERDRRADQLDRGHSWETEKALDATNKEITAVLDQLKKAVQK